MALLRNLRRHGYFVHRRCAASFIAFVNALAPPAALVVTFFSLHHYADIVYGPSAL